MKMKETKVKDWNYTFDISTKGQPKVEFIYFF